MKEYPGLLNLIVVFTDGNSAHCTQAFGVADRLADLTGAEVVRFDVPKLTGVRTVLAKLRCRQLLEGRKEAAISWLKCAKGEHLLRSVASVFSKMAIRENSGKVLLVSAGSNASVYNLAVATIWKVACAAVGMPSIIGSSCFDFAIIPEYEDPPRASNILRTVTPPNNIRTDLLQVKAAELKQKCHPKSEKVWSVLLGGDNEHYRLTASFLKQLFSQLIAKAEIQDADLYITTSYRTGKECVNMLKQLAKDNEGVIRYLHIATEDDINPVPALLGLADTVFCTEDSINMVSEAVTGSSNVVLLRTDKVSGLKRLLLKADQSLIERGAIPREFAFGTVKFDLIYDRLKRHDKLIEFRDWLKRGDKRHSTCFNLPDTGSVWKDFNEARRAANWIAKSLVR